MVEVKVKVLQCVMEAKVVECDIEVKGVEHMEGKVV